MGLFGNRGNGERKGGRLKQAFEMAKPALNLSQQQENQIIAIFKDFTEERRELKGGGDDPKEAIRAARKEAKQKIMAVLSDDQKRILEEHMSQWKDQAD